MNRKEEIAKRVEEISLEMKRGHKEVVRREALSLVSAIFTKWFQRQYPDTGIQVYFAEVTEDVRVTITNLTTYEVINLTESLDDFPSNHFITQLALLAR